MLSTLLFSALLLSALHVIAHVDSVTTTRTTWIFENRNNGNRAFRNCARRGGVVSKSAGAELVFAQYSTCAARTNREMRAADGPLCGGLRAAELSADASAGRRGAIACRVDSLTMRVSVYMHSKDAAIAASASAAAELCNCSRLDSNRSRCLLADLRTQMIVGVAPSSRD